MNTLLEARRRHGAEISVWLLAACTGTQSQPKAEAPNVRHAGAASIPSASPLRKSLQFAAAEEHTVERPSLVRCAVKAHPAWLIKVVASVSGRVVELRKMRGDAVKNVDAFLAIDSANLTQATNKTTKARAALAQRNLQRQTKLAQAEIAACKDLEQAEGDFAQAQSETERTKVRLGQVGTGLGSGGGRQHTLRLQIVGRVIELNGGRGVFWNDTDAPVTPVTDLSDVWMAARVRETDLASPFVGQAAGGLRLRQYPGLRGALATGKHQAHAELRSA